MFYNKKASGLLVSLILISSVLSILFLNRDNFLLKENNVVILSKQYLLDRINLLKLYNSFHQNKLNKNKICNKLKKESISFSDFSDLKFNFINYQFLCKKESIFKKGNPNKGYIYFDNIHEYLTLSGEEEYIYYINSLSELPESSATEPKIVIAQSKINGRLDKDFYGLLITRNEFDITNKRIKGVVFSSYDNERNDRDFSYDRTTIINLEKQFSYWFYLPGTENIMEAIDVN